MLILIIVSLCRLSEAGASICQKTWRDYFLGPPCPGPGTPTAPCRWDGGPITEAIDAN